MTSVVTNSGAITDLSTTGAPGTLNTALTTGVGHMVDADMTAESARLAALQTQQLGVPALSIANQAPQAILKLFG